MCGIFGIIGKTENGPIDKSLNAIKHRGPDDSGQYHDDNVILGFRRLSIIDLSPQGHQPMSNEDATVWVIFNGEIYNFQELRKQLSIKHRWKSHTDTEVLLHGYEEWGIERLLKKINGMFAFCLYDQNKQLAYLVRDRIGKKPLYYWQHKKSVVFSSETKAFFQLPDFNFQIDPEMFKLWMGFPYLPENDRTIIKNVVKVPPASFLTVTADGKTQLRQYWQLPRETLKINFDLAQQRLEKLLINAVNTRMVADVPIGILLSGGLDSSLITALAAKQTKSPVKTITIAFKNSVIDETPYAHTVAKYCRTDHIDLTLEIADVYEEFRSHISIYDDLSTVDSGLFSTYLLSRKIRELGVRVVLVGEGSDELFAGYSWFQLSQYPFRLLPDYIKTQLYYYAIERSLPNHKFFGYSQYLHRQLRENGDGFFKQMQRYEIKRSLPNHYCMKVDKATMAASIEARAPFMDYHVAGFANQLPVDHLLHSSFYNPKQSQEKYIIRKIAQRYLPKTIWERKKKGGMIPVYDLLQQGLEKDRNLILTDDYLVDFYGHNYLARLIDARPSLPIWRWQREWILWKCLVFALWRKHFTAL